MEKSFFAIISRSTSPISVIFFCCDEDDELYPTKKIAEIGSLDCKIIFLDLDRVRLSLNFQLIRSESDLKIQNTIKVIYSMIPKFN